MIFYTEESNNRWNPYNWLNVQMHRSLSFLQYFKHLNLLKHVSGNMKEGEKQVIIIC